MGKCYESEGCGGDGKCKYVVDPDAGCNCKFAPRLEYGGQYWVMFTQCDGPDNIP